MIEFIVGRAGSGKSTLIYKKISEKIRAGEKAVLIVPEQYTYEAEKELSNYMGNGIINVSVYSFTTLAKTILAECGERRIFLSSQGKLMIIRKIIEDNKSKLEIFKNACEKSSFAEKLDEMFKMFKRFNITPDMLINAVENSEDAAFAGKIKEIAILYNAMQEYLSDKYIDNEDGINAFIENIGKSRLKGANIFIDGLDLITSQLVSIIKELIINSKDLCMSLIGDLSEKCQDSRVYEPTMIAYRKIISIVKEENKQFKVTELKKTLGRGEELIHLADELYSLNPKKYDKQVSDITLFAATDVLEEVKHVAEIISDIAVNGIRYNEITVVVSNVGLYANTLKRIFEQYEIPIYMDEKRPLVSHKACDAVLSALRSIYSGYNQTDIIRLIKSGFADISEDEAEIFENYVIANGINGSKFKSVFTKGNEVPEEAESARIKIMEPLERLHNSVSDGTVAERTKALYAYMRETKMYEKLYDTAKGLAENGEYKLKSENEQVFNKMIELFDQMYSIMGDMKISLKKYISVIEEGISAYEIGTIPSTLDRVLVGGVTRTHSRNAKVLFALGCNEGLFPEPHSDDDIIDDEEVAILRDKGIELLIGTSIRGANDQLAIYKSLTKPTEKLHLSYIIAGDNSTPAIVVDRIKEIFPNINEKTNIELKENCLKSTAIATAPELVKELRKFADGEQIEAEVSSVYSWFRRNAQFSEFMDSIENALFFKASPSKITEKEARQLYGDTIKGSASRLELFNRCPFSHFVKYGLKAEERKVYKEKTVDEGSLYHSILERLIKEITIRNIYKNEFDEDVIDAILAEITGEIIAEHNGGILVETPRARLKYSHMLGVIKSISYAVVKQLYSSNFRPYEYGEVEFGDGKTLDGIVISLKNGKKFIIRGIIDRLDIMHDGDNLYLRVVDYKTGGLDFEFGELYEGIKMQLPLYVEAAMSSFEKHGKEKNQVAVGMYYMPVKEAIAAADTPDEKIESKITDLFRMNGLTIDDYRIVMLMEEFDSKSKTISSIECDKDKTKIIGKSCVTQEQMTAIRKYAVKKSQESLASMLDGNIDVLPTKTKRKTACDWCEYSAVCNFDTNLSDCKYKNISEMKKEEFFERISDKDKQGE